MADDIFGDDSLFSEFERDRNTQNIFIHYDQDDSGTENRSRIVFEAAESGSEASDDEDRSEIETGTETKNDPAAAENNGHQKSPEPDSSAGDQQMTEEPEPREQEANKGPQTTSYQEQFQKNKYRQIARLVDSTRCVTDEQSPGVQVVFHNNKFAKKYRSRIEQFIVSLTEHSDKKDFTKVAAEFTGRISVPSCLDINDTLPPEKRNNRMLQLHEITGCAQFHHGFMVDSRGCPHDADEQTEISSGEAPKYFQVFDEIFPPDETIAPPSKPGRQKNSCFNCGGEHRLNECTVPKDQNRIRIKRREQQERSANSKPSNPNRYHEDPELDPAKVKFEAGFISDSLRDAMGLTTDQLPSYIYRMRLFGYPPGWLMEANRKAAVLAMYDRDGRETNLRGESLEDGECGEQASPDAAETFDLNKIIEYPGFTVPVPLGFIDNSDSLGMPPIQQHQLKKTLMEDVVAKEGAKKRRLEEGEVEKKKKLKTQDMEVEEEGEVMSTPVDTSTPEGADKKGEREEAEEVSSPTMDRLQQEYLNLVKQLDSEGDPSAVTNGNPSAAAAAAQTPTEKSLLEAELLREKNFSFTSSASISRDYGTPILVREKSFRAVPSPDKFGQGIEDHIPYENLPDSVGTFDKMKNLFSLIRNKVKSLKK